MSRQFTFNNAKRHPFSPLLAGMLVLMLVLSGCSSTQVTVQKATQQKYYGGAPGSGGGNIYRLYISKSSKTEMTIDRAWVGDREKGYLPKVTVYSDSSDTVLRDRIMPVGITLARVEFVEYFKAGPNPRMEGEDEDNGPAYDEPPYDLPVDFREGTVIWYTLSNGKTGTWMPENYEVLPPLAMP